MYLRDLAVGHSYSEASIPSPYQQLWKYRLCSCQGLQSKARSPKSQGRSPELLQEGALVCTLLQVTHRGKLEKPNEGVARGQRSLNGHSRISSLPPCGLAYLGIVVVFVHMHLRCQRSRTLPALTWCSASSRKSGAFCGMAVATENTQDPPSLPETRQVKASKSIE